MTEPAIDETLVQLVIDLDLGVPQHITRIPGGRNNRVYRVDAGGRSMLMKHYYSSADDPRDRLAADFGFSRFAWDHGIRSIAEPLAAHLLFGIAVYEFVEGQRLQPASVTRERVWEALEFLVALNAHRTSREARALPFASEACFSLADHLDTVEARIRRLQRAGADYGKTASHLIARLAAAWEQVRRQITHRHGNVFSTPVHRCLSPSDFGFHNVIVRGDQRLVFHDFEYAGWDDPAKLVCDFFLQVDAPVPRGLLDDFDRQLAEALDLPPDHRHRVEMLFPVHRLKWCCLILNGLLPDAAQRRRFAGFADGCIDNITIQLQRAERLLSGVEEELDGLR